MVFCDQAHKLVVHGTPGKRVVVVDLAHGDHSLLHQGLHGAVGRHACRCVAQHRAVDPGDVLDQLLRVLHLLELLFLQLEVIAELDAFAAQVLAVGVEHGHHVGPHHVAGQILDGVVLRVERIAFHDQLLRLEHPLNAHAPLVVLVLGGQHAGNQAVGAAVAILTEAPEGDVGEVGARRGLIGQPVRAGEDGLPHLACDALFQLHQAAADGLNVGRVALVHRDPLLTHAHDHDLSRHAVPHLVHADAVAHAVDPLRSVHPRPGPVSLVERVDAAQVLVGGIVGEPGLPAVGRVLQGLGMLRHECRHLVHVFPLPTHQPLGIGQQPVLGSPVPPHLRAVHVGHPVLVQARVADTGDLNPADAGLDLAGVAVADGHVRARLALGLLQLHVQHVGNIGAFVVVGLQARITPALGLLAQNAVDHAADQVDAARVELVLLVVVGLCRAELVAIVVGAAQVSMLSPARLLVTVQKQALQGVEAVTRLGLVVRRLAGATVKLVQRAE